MTQQLLETLKEMFFEFGVDATTGKPINHYAAKLAYYAICEAEGEPVTPEFEKEVQTIKQHLKNRGVFR